MREISLSRGLVTLVDDADWGTLTAVKWSAAVDRWGGAYASRLARFSDGTYHALSMHRQIMGLGLGDRRQVDHADRNGLNNQRHNLRLATPSQNGANQRKPRTNYGLPCSSPYRGVFLNRRRGKWQAAIRVDGQKRHLGCFADEATAARAYDVAAEAAWGEFASLNFPARYS